MIMMVVVVEGRGLLEEENELLGHMYVTFLNT
jgi:hypothetical protein